MPFLSLGLHNDEPPTSFDQGEKDQGEKDQKEKHDHAREAVNALPPAAQARAGQAEPNPPRRTQPSAPTSANAPRAPHFLIAENENGNGHGNGNGHSADQQSYSNEFEADQFEDGPDAPQAAEKLRSWMSAAVQPETAQPTNGNGRASTPASAPSSFTPSPFTPPVASRTDADKNVRATRTTSDENGGHAVSLPPSVELLRRKLAEEEKLRTAAVRPGPLTASVDGLSSSERQWVPTFATFKFGYLPGQGLLFSTIGHEVLIFGLFLLVTYVLPMLQPAKLIATNNPQDHIIILPELGGGSAGEKSPGAGESAPQQPSAAPARSSKGFAFPGKQAILSNPANPTNTFQTIQRPLLVHPERITRLVPAPNIVRMAETRLPRDVIAPKPAMPHLLEVPKPIRVKQDTLTHRDAKFDVPVDMPKLVAKMDMPKLPAAQQPLPEAPKVQPQPKKEDEKREIEKPSPTPIKVTSEKRAEPQEKTSPPSQAQIARMEMHGKDKEPLLSLSPMPLPNGPDAKIPNGEALGKFAIAPGGTLNPTSITPGKANGTPSTTPGTGQENAKAPNAAGSDAASNSGSANAKGTAGAGGPGHATIANGSGTAGTGGGTGNAPGAGTGGAGAGKGRGTVGQGVGSAGNQQSNGSGAGAGSGSGTGSFPGITIQGGENANASSKANNKPPAFTIEPQTAYGMTIVSTASSGGGLEDFGVFQNERIFTVYIPVKPSPDLPDPTWTMQYAVIKDGTVPDPGSQQVVPPSVATSEWPQIPPNLQKKYARRQVVIFAIVGADGKVSQVSVKRTPDTKVSDAIAATFRKWVFHPALVNNQPVGVKILVGIPLS